MTFDPINGEKMQSEQITLYYREGSSDKVYQVQLKPQDGGWVVNFHYGRRGSTLTSGTKTQNPVEYAKAKKEYDKVVKEKTSKGYTPGEDGTPFAGAEKSGQVSGILPQLLNPMEEDDLEYFISSETHWMQEKYDGKRTLLRKVGQTVEAINRKGLVVDIPSALERETALVDCDFILDGEAIGDALFAFDLLSYNGDDLRSCPYIERMNILQHIAGQYFEQYLQLAKTAKLQENKRKLYDELKAARREGVVFKERGGIYTAGRPNSGGTQRKLKFVTTATVKVLCVNNKRSVEVGVLDSGAYVPVGNVTISANHSIPAIGDLVEVRYLYAFPRGSLYQPVYLGTRADKDVADTVTALKYKSAETDNDSDQ